jgi:hypothetical protein
MVQIERWEESNDMCVMKLSVEKAETRTWVIRSEIKYEIGAASVFLCLIILTAVARNANSIRGGRARAKVSVLVKRL